MSLYERAFRNSKAWRTFRHEMNVKQYGKDPSIMNRIIEEFSKWY